MQDVVKKLKKNKIFSCIDTSILRLKKFSDYKTQEIGDV